MTVGAGRPDTAGPPITFLPLGVVLVHTVNMSTTIEIDDELAERIEGHLEEDETMGEFIEELVNVYETEGAFLQEGYSE
ncbi:hypothetical protein ACFQMA_04765 [Halosimplex aquaticum]|uniref:Ribbon-helix-helix protein, copG family n=1 Tax=Halosimplex aquaticum TaxID=3026162 RepID=A0ABD5Y417_9EURY|nr:hypothetical protein [Halosimplex aquaticum]